MGQVHVFFTGMVQGVGFRYTVHRYASGLGVTGWVKNLKDGRVELVAEGDRPALDDLIRRVDEQFEGYIRDKDVQFSESPPQHKDFKIVH